MSFNTFWKFLRRGNSAWDFLGVNLWSRFFFLSRYFFFGGGVWFLPPFDHFPSIEIWSTPSPHLGLLVTAAHESYFLLTVLSLFPRRHYYLRGWLETVVRLMQHVAWDNSRHFPTFPLVSREMTSSRVRLKVSRSLATQYSTSKMWYTGRGVVLLIKPIESLQFSWVRHINNKRKGHWRLISGFEQLYMVAERSKKIEKDTYRSRGEQSQSVIISYY